MSKNRDLQTMAEPNFKSKTHGRLAAFGFGTIPWGALRVASHVGLTPLEAVVAAAAMEYIGSGSNTIDRTWVVWDSIAEKTGFSVRTVRRAVSSMLRRNLIAEVSKQGRTKYYDFRGYEQAVGAVFDEMNREETGGSSTAESVVVAEPVIPAEPPPAKLPRQVPEHRIPVVDRETGLCPGYYFELGQGIKPKDLPEGSEMRTILEYQDMGFGPRTMHLLADLNVHMTQLARAGFTLKVLKHDVVEERPVVEMAVVRVAELNQEKNDVG